MRESSPLFWPVAELTSAFRSGDLSPVEVTSEALERIGTLNAVLRAYVTVTAEGALEQARDAERRYRAGGATPALLGVPMAIKDLFDVRGVPTSLGSLVHRHDIAQADSGVVAALRAAGATFLGKSNTAEFGQSATTENLLGAGCANPWDSSRTSGGSSGGSAAAVGAGLAAVSLGSDGGGSIRIPAALCGLFGLKPTYGAVSDDTQFRAMTDFACPGPIVRRVADARPLMAAMTGRTMARGDAGRLRIAWCARPQGRPVDPGVSAATQGAVALLEQLGHDVVAVDLPLNGWIEAFGPLVLADEWAERRHLLEGPEALTHYARRSIEAAAALRPEDLEEARRHMAAFRAQIDALLADHDLIVTPTTATTAFPIGQRPTEIAGERVDALWGAFPFTAPFNVAGSPAASVPCGLSDGLPVGLQIVGSHGAEALLLDLSEDLEEALDFPRAEMAARWDAAAPRVLDGHVTVERRGHIAVVRLVRPAKRNALTLDMLERLRAAFAGEAVRGATATVLTGGPDVFSAGADLNQVGHGVGDLAMDDAVAAAAEAIRAAPMPVIGAIEGPCMGAAVELAVACDVLVAGRTSSFAVPATRLGILYRPAALRDLVARLGHQTVSRLVLLGQSIAAPAARSTGIVAEVVDDGEALAAALDIALPTADAIPRATAQTKAVLVEVERRESTRDLADWEPIRRELLEERARRATPRVGGETTPADVHA